ncbi:hypothetical protein DFAR_3980008 [Desulfarculales bacterium]
MGEDQKKRVAIFRFGVISDFLARNYIRNYMERGERERLLRDKCARRWRISFSNRTRPSRSAILGGGPGSTAKAAASWHLFTPWAGMTVVAAGPWIRKPLRPRSVCGENCPLRQRLPSSAR